jgi:para-nitrobenzyl esterase
MSEDCLYLNVTVPVIERGAAPKPVIVWIHGGGGSAGTGSEYDPHRMVERGDVIVVTINYRLGIFGFFGYPGLKDSGSFAMEDQIAALRWVRRNAPAFGGDATNITVAGESEGAVSICGLLTSPASKGSFDKAILESGSCSTLVNDLPPGSTSARPNALSFWTSVDQVKAAGMTFASDVAVNSPGLSHGQVIERLRLESADDLNEASIAESQERGISFATAAYRTPLLPLDPALALRLGRFHRVPLISGINQDEDRSVTMLTEYIAGEWRMSSTDYARLISEAFASRAPDVAAHYPLQRYESPAAAWSSIETDRTFVCPQLETDHAVARQGVPVYAFEFADRSAPPFIPYDPNLTDLKPGADHGDEIFYLLDVLGAPHAWGGSQLPHPWFSPKQEALAESMIRYWTHFAHTGDPNTKNQPLWSRFEGRRGPVLRLDTAGAAGIGLVETYRNHQCGFWSAVSSPAGEDR